MAILQKYLKKSLPTVIPMLYHAKWKYAKFQTSRSIINLAYGPRPFLLVILLGAQVQDIYISASEGRRDLILGSNEPEYASLFMLNILKL